MSKRFRLFLIDGSSYIYRAFYAIGHLSNSKGLPTNAIFGFTQMILKILKEHKPDYMAIAFDSKGPTFRSEVFREYKSNRPAMPDTLTPQIPYIKKIIEAYGIVSIEIEGFEADDIIGTLAKMFENIVDVKIITGDKDILQLVNERIEVYDTMKERYFGIEEVKERFGVSPEQIVEVMGLSGDPIDNIPGIPGIGERTAIELIKNYGTIDNLLSNLDEIKKKGLKEKLETYVELARLSRELAKIKTDLSLSFKLEDLSLNPPDIKTLRQIFKELEFNKLLKELPDQKENYSEKDYQMINDEDSFLKLIKVLMEKKRFSIDLETTSAHPMWADIVGISISHSKDQAFYIPLTHKIPGYKQLPLSWVIERLKPVLEDISIRKIGQNIKYEWIVFKRYNIDLKGIECDTMVASYLLNPTKHNHNLSELAREYLDRDIIEYNDVTGSGEKSIPFDEVDPKKPMVYGCQDAELALELHQILILKLEEGGFRELFENIEIPLITVLGKMEMNGVKIDVDFLNDYSKEIENQLNQKIEKIYSLAGEVFNINSSRQLGKILFEKLNLPTIKKTKTGYSTDVEVLTKLSLYHDLPLEILSYRNLSKLKSTYIDALPKLIHPKTCRIHTSYNQTVTATGRLSSSDPNLQNIPIRAEEGNRIRQTFIPEKGWILISADYSQIELRILAHLSQDETLIEAFKSDEDIHARTASEIFGVPIDKVTPNMRRDAKVINFGIIYGMSPYGLSQQLGIDQKVAEDYINRYFTKYRGVYLYIQKTLEEARKNGYVKTPLNRRRYLPELQSPIASVRQASERMAINTPLQGTAADIIKIAMIRIQNRIEELGLSTKMIIQVHDELVFEVPEKEFQTAISVIKNEMEKVIELLIPIKVSIHWGKNWAEAH